LKAEFSTSLLLLITQFQCHMILQKSFQYADLMLKKHKLLFSMLKILNSMMNRKFKRTAFI